MRTLGITAALRARRRAAVAAVGLLLAVPTLVLWADAAMAAESLPTTTTTEPPPPTTTEPPPPTTTEPPPTTTLPPPTTTLPPPTTTEPPPTTTLPPPTTTEPPPATTVPGPVPPPTAPTLPAPPALTTGSTPFGPVYPATLGAVFDPSAPVSVPALTLPVDLSTPESQVDALSAFGTFTIDPQYTTRQTLPSNFFAIQEVSTSTAYVPPAGLSPGDILLLGIATACGCLLVAWEVSEETEWST